MLGCFEGHPLGGAEMMDLDSVEIEHTLDDNFDEASLEMSDGSLLVCSVCVVRQSAYLLDMSKVRFINGKLLSRFLIEFFVRRLTQSKPCQYQAL